MLIQDPGKTRWINPLLLIAGIPLASFGASAQLLDINTHLEKPIMISESAGSTRYDEVSNIFTAIMLPSYINFLDGTSNFVIDSSNDGSKRAQIIINVDEMGQVIPGSNNDHLQMYGTLDLNSNFQIDPGEPSGLLLQGQVSEFGFNRIGVNNSEFDFVFTVTGGLLESHFVGKKIGIYYLSESSNFSGNFNVDITEGIAKGRLGALSPMPDIALCTLVSLTGDDPFYDADNIPDSYCDSYFPDIPEGVVDQTDASYKLVVINTGDEVLESVTVTDNDQWILDVPGGPMAPNDMRMITPQDYNELFYPNRCQSVVGSQTLNVDVKGTGEISGIDVMDQDPASITCTSVPGISLRKEVSVNGSAFVDANTVADAAMGILGSDVEYRLVVENTGTEPLVNVELDDAQLLVEERPLGSLAIGEQRIIASGDVSELFQAGHCDAIGNKLNTAVVSAYGQYTGPANGTVEASDPAYISCENPQVEILKQVQLNGQGGYVDADIGDDAPIGLVGSDASYRFIIRNLGSEVLTNVSIVDTELGIDLPISSPIAELAVDEEKVIHSGVLGFEGLDVTGRCDQPGDLLNTAVIHATGQDSGAAVTDANPAYVRCVNPPSIELLKQVSLDGVTFYDADSADVAATGERGVSATYRLIVNNTGDEELVNVTLTDLDLGIFAYQLPGGPLPAGESRTILPTTPGEMNEENFEALFVANRCWNEGIIENVASVAGEGAQTGEVVSDDNPAFVNCTNPQIEIVKRVSLTGEAPFHDANNESDADVPVGAVGSDAHYQLVVTNVGSEILTNVMVSDDSLGIFNVGVGDLMPGQSHTITELSQGFGALHKINRCDAAGELENIASVSASGSNTGAEVDSNDPAWVRCIEGPAIELRKLVSLDGVIFSEADTAEQAVEGQLGADAYYRLVVRNVGDEVLQNVVINDDTLNIVNAAFDGDLLPDQEVVLEQGSGGQFAALFKANRCDAVGNHLNIAQVNAEGSLTGQPVSDDDPANVNCIQVAVCELSVEQTCAPVIPPSDDLLCQAAIKATTLRYTGPTIDNATVTIKGKKNGYVRYDGVNLISGQTVLTQQNGFTIDSGDMLGAKTEITINGIKEIIHTSCSAIYVANQPAPLDGNTPNPANSEKGDPSPNWFVVNFEDKEGGLVQGPTAPLPGTNACTVDAGGQLHFETMVRNMGDTDIALNSIFDDKQGELLPYTPYMLPKGEQMMMSTMVTASDGGTSSVTVSGHAMGDAGASCMASDAVEVIVEQPPIEPISCSELGGISQLSMVWNGPDGVNITTDHGQTFTGVNHGNQITFNTSSEDSWLTVSGAVSGLSNFHLSCSDEQMNGSEDCGKAQGNGKDPKVFKNKGKGKGNGKGKGKGNGGSDKPQATVDLWLLDGMKGSKDSFSCGLDNTGTVVPQ